MLKLVFMGLISAFVGYFIGRAHEKSIAVPLIKEAHALVEKTLAELEQFKSEDPLEGFEKVGAIELTEEQAQKIMEVIHGTGDRHGNN